jgi:hypothetical protein
MSKPPKKHHVVPQYYLKGFTDPADPELVYVFRRGERPFRTGVKGVAFINDFYTYTDDAGNKHSIERDLADKIEGPTNEVLAKLRALQPITLLEKAVLARYISVMLTRVPRHRQRAEAWLPEVVEDFRPQLSVILDELMANAPPAIESREELLARGQAYLDQYKATPPDHLSVGLVSDKYAHVFANMKWVFFTAPMSSHRGFLTSDNPVFFFEDVGLVGKDGPSEMVEVIFPISTQLALWATWRGIPGMDDMVYVPAPEPVIEKINHRTVFASLREVYYSSNPRWVRSLVGMDKAEFRLKRIV